MRRKGALSSRQSGSMVAVVKKLMSLTIEIIHTRLQLAVTEPEEENRLFQLILLTGLPLVFTAFGTIRLLVYALLIATFSVRSFTLQLLLSCWLPLQKLWRFSLPENVSAQRNPQIIWSGSS